LKECDRLTIKKVDDYIICPRECSRGEERIVETVVALAYATAAKRYIAG